MVNDDLAIPRQKMRNNIAFQVCQSHVDKSVCKFYLSLGDTSLPHIRGSTELTIARYSYVPHKREGKIIDGRVQTISLDQRVPHQPSP